MMASALYAGCPQAVFATVNEVQVILQSGTVKGQIVDENGEPIIGATVMLTKRHIERSNHRPQR